MAVTASLAAVGLVSGAIGAKKQAKAQDRASAAASAAAQFNPFGVQTPGGSVSWNGTNAYGSMSPEQQQMYGLFGQQANQYLGGMGPTQGFQNYANGVGNEQLPGFFNQAQDAAGQLPTGEYANNQAMLGMLGPQAQGIFNTQQGLFGQAASLAGQDVNGLVTQRLDLLRQQAAPQEQRALDMVSQSAFNRGQLGGPGGRLALEQFGNAISQADLGRQVEAQNLGLQAQQNNYQGAGLFGNLGAQYGQSGIQNLGFQGDISNSQFGNATNMSNLIASRGQQRLQNATGLFGFGQELGNQDFTRGLNASTAQGGMDTNLRNLIALGGNIGGQQAQAGANQGQFMMQNGGSPGGAFLSSLGTGLFSQAMGNMNLGGKPDMGGYGVRSNAPWAPQQFFPAPTQYNGPYRQ